MQTLVCAEVVQWAETYTGPPFHAMVTDPPYGLEFMGHDWDNPDKWRAGGGFSQPGIGARPTSWPSHGGETANPTCATCRGRLRGQKRCVCESPEWHVKGEVFTNKTYERNAAMQAMFTTWFAALARHLLPGAFLFAFASSRGYHRLACAMEDAGLILHPTIFNYRTGETREVESLWGWGYGSGFPKATRIDTAVDREAGMPQEVIGIKRAGIGRNARNGGELVNSEANEVAKRVVMTAPATPLAAAWAGHRYGGQALKPALEPILCAQKPYAGAPVTSITTTGAGALWIEGARIAGPSSNGGSMSGISALGQLSGWNQHNNRSVPIDRSMNAGRWPPNFALTHLTTCEPLGLRQVCNPSGPASGPTASKIGGYGGIFVAPDGQRERVPYYGSEDGTETVQAYHCGAGCPVAAFEAQAGERQAGGSKDCRGQQYHYRGAQIATRDQVYDSYGASGPASRFFFTADWSLDIAERLAATDPVLYCPKASAAERANGLGARNPHPCIKPLSLCKWLATLLLPPAAYAPRRLLVPFCGTGSEMIGGILAGWETVVGIDHTPTYVHLAGQRLAWWTGMIPQGAASPSPPPAVVPQNVPDAQLGLFTQRPGE